MKDLCSGNFSYLQAYSSITFRIFSDFFFIVLKYYTSFSSLLQLKIKSKSSTLSTNKWPKRCVGGILTHCSAYVVLWHKD